MTEKEEKNLNEELDKEQNVENQQAESAEGAAAEPVKEEKAEEAKTEETVSAEKAEETVQQVAPEEKEADVAVAEKPAEEFDWDKYATDADSYSQGDRQKFEAMYDETLSTIAENEVVEGTVIAMNKREVVVNIGYKSEGVVSLNEFRYNPELAMAIL